MSFHILDNSNIVDNSKSKVFLDDSGTTTVARYDNIKHRIFDKLTETQLGFFWRPQEIDITKDQKDFRSLTDHEQHIFTSNLKRQIILDSVQGRAPNLSLLPICSIPELEVWVQTWSFFETIHSKSYTHIIRNIFSDPSKVFDNMLDIPDIAACTVDITKYYDDLIRYTQWYHLLGEGRHTVNGKHVTVSKYELKKKLWICLNSINALEGIRFYVSFACSWSFAELKKMEGNAKIIKLICRDENLHLASTQALIKLLPNDDEDFAKIAKETEDECIAIFVSAVDQEKAWADYLFKDGSMIGLNAELLKDYVEYIAHQRIQNISLDSPYKSRSNPLPWTTKWISGKEVQVAPQQVQLSSYKVGDAKMDVTDKSFKGMSL